MDYWTATKSIQGSMELRGMMQKSCLRLSNAKQSVMTAVKSKKDLFFLYQNPQVSNTYYLWCFKALGDATNTGLGMEVHRP